VSPPWVLAIDGPSAAGKTTVGRLVAERLGWAVLDTGLLYRAITLAAVRTGVRADDPAGLARLVAGLDLQVRPPSRRDGRTADVLLDGEDVTLELRQPAVEAAVSAVSAHRAVREAMVAVQRRAVDERDTVVVGRDIGTVVFPDAPLKIYLDASDRERARRRQRELQTRGIQRTLDEVLEELRRRDTSDRTRALAPLRPAADAVVLPTDGLSVEEVVERVLALVRERRDV
jgi:cytidylate kinase